MIKGLGKRCWLSRCRAVASAFDVHHVTRIAHLVTVVKDCSVHERRSANARHSRAFVYMPECMNRGRQSGHAIEKRSIAAFFPDCVRVANRCRRPVRYQKVGFLQKKRPLLAQAIFVENEAPTTTDGSPRRTPIANAVDVERSIAEVIDRGKELPDPGRF